MSEESSCTPLWYWITFLILSIINVVMGIYYWYDWRFSRREKLQKSKKNKEGGTQIEGQKTGTGEQP